MPSFYLPELSPCDENLRYSYRYNLLRSHHARRLSDYPLKKIEQLLRFTALALLTLIIQGYVSTICQASESDSIFVNDVKIDEVKVEWAKSRFSISIVNLQGSSTQPDENPMDETSTARVLAGFAQQLCSDDDIEGIILLPDPAVFQPDLQFNYADFKLVPPFSLDITDCDPDFWYCLTLKHFIHDAQGSVTVDEYPCETRRCGDPEHCSEGLCPVCCPNELPNHSGYTHVNSYRIIPDRAVDAPCDRYILNITVQNGAGRSPARAFGISLLNFDQLPALHPVLINDTVFAFSHPGLNLNRFIQESPPETVNTLLIQCRERHVISQTARLEESENKTAVLFPADAASNPAFPVFKPDKQYSPVLLLGEGRSYNPPDDPAPNQCAIVRTLQQILNLTNFSYIIPSPPVVSMVTTITISNTPGSTPTDATKTQDINLVLASTGAAMGAACLITAVILVTLGIIYYHKKYKGNKINPADLNKSP